MNYGNIKKTDVANGPGVRVTLFVSGCRNRCPGCHNQSAQEFSYGKPFDDGAQDEIIEALRPDYIQGLTLCGGEPFEPENQKELLPFIRKVKRIYPKKDIWAWTGYEWWDLLPGGKKCTEDTLGLLFKIKALVCGRFILDERDISDLNRWRGSRNQYIIDVEDSLLRCSDVFLSGMPNNVPRKFNNK